MPVALRLDLPTRIALDGGDDLFGAVRHVSSEEAFDRLVASVDRTRDDTVVFRLARRPVGGMDEVDLYFDLPALPEMTMDDLEGRDLRGGFRIAHGDAVYVGLPRQGGDLGPFLILPSLRAEGYRSFERWEIVAPVAREAIEKALSSIEAFDVRGLLDGDLLERTRLHLSHDGSRPVADVLSAITGYRRIHLRGKGFDGEERDTWVARIDGVAENDAHHVSSSGFGGWLDLAPQVGRSATDEDLPAMSPDEASVLTEGSAHHALALAWIDHAPIPSFSAEWFIELREAAFGPSPRRQACPGPAAVRPAGP